MAGKINFKATEINNLCSLEDATRRHFTTQLSNEEIQSYETHSFEFNVPSRTLIFYKHMKAFLINKHIKPLTKKISTSKALIVDCKKLAHE